MLMIIVSEDGVSKVVAGKLSDELWARVQSRLQEEGTTANALIVQLLEGWAPRRAGPAVPAVPPKSAKPPPVPPKKSPHLLPELLMRLDRMLGAGDDIPEWLAEEAMRADVALDCWSNLRKDELQQIRHNLIVLAKRPDTFERGCLEAAEEEFRASLPKLTLGQ